MRVDEGTRIACVALAPHGEEEAAEENGVQGTENRE